MKKYSMKRTFAHKQSVQGATLVEVLVSVFLLTFGILGLMAAQLNSVAAVSESENRAIAAQAAENLAEAMQANPDLTADGKRDYDKYLKKTDWGKWDDVALSIPSCANSTAPSANSKDACALGSDPISKAELAKAHLDEFQFVLKQMPNTVELKYVVCLDTVDGLAKEAEEPKLSDTQCSNTGQPVIKVIWSAMGADKETDTGIPDTEGKKQLYYLVLSE